MVRYTKWNSNTLTNLNKEKNLLHYFLYTQLALFIKKLCEIYVRYGGTWCQEPICHEPIPNTFHSDTSLRMNYCVAAMLSVFSI